ncbi:MAG: ral secretion pathway protein, partial [Patescibacteria group bacterium]|nr:ral secretion pathway protein [Patescibacteria group bacterium]
MIKTTSVSSNYSKPDSPAFTIVELLIVIVIIGILAAITLVSYTGIASRANIATIQSDLSNASKKLSMYY